MRPSISRAVPGGRPRGGVWGLGLGALAAICCSSPAAGGPAPEGREPNPVRPPYVSEIYTYDLGGHGLGPEITFWEFTDRAKPAWGLANRRRVAELLKRSIRPIHGLVRWGTEYVDGLPGGSRHGDPPYRAWSEWHKQHEDLFMRMANGEVFHRGWGVISPCMPLDERDWPPGVREATYGDWFVWKLSGLYEQAGLVGSFAADFYDCLPHTDCGNADFHPRVIAAFEKRMGVAVPPGSIPERAAFIKKNLMHEWIQFFCEGYGRVWGGIARAVKEKTGFPGFVGMQGTYNAFFNRWIGRDVRLIEKYVVHEAGGRGLRVVELQGDSDRPLTSVSLGYGYLLDFACQAPDLWIGAQMNCPDKQEFRDSLDRTFRGDGSLKQEFASKYIRGHWLTVAWAHIAGRDGSVRRAVQVFHRQYWDSGRIPEDLERVALGVAPARPFGPAFYWSQSVATALERRGRSFEAERWKSALVDRGVPVGYAVSDATLAGLRLRPESRPTAFLVPQLELVPAEERAALEAIAPAFDLEKAARQPREIPSPLRFSAEVCGYGFHDREGRLVILVWRPSGTYGSDPMQFGNTDTVASVTIAWPADGRYTATDLFDPSASFPFVVAGKTGTFSFPLSRWECRAFRVDMVATEAKRERPVEPAARPAAATRSVKPEKLAAWDSRLASRLREELARGAEIAFHLAFVRGRARLLAIDGSNALKVSSGGLEMPVAWEALSLADRQSLALALAASGAPGDSALAAFYLLARNEEELAAQYLARAGDLAAEVRAAFE